MLSAAAPWTLQPGGGHTTRPTTPLVFPNKLPPSVHHACKYLQSRWDLPVRFWGKQRRDLIPGAIKAWLAKL